jgi:hypothetical protein
MPVVRTGTPVLIQNSSQSGSQSITIPSDCQTIVVAISAYKNSTNWIATNPCTIDGSNVTTVRKTDSTSAINQNWLGYILNATTGSKTFAWDMGTTFTFGLNISIIFYKNVDLDSPLVSSNLTTTDGADVTGLTAGATDMMVGIVSSEGGNATVTDNSQTEISVTSYNSEYHGVAEKLNGDGFYFTGSTFTSASALVLRYKEAPAVVTNNGYSFFM